MSRYQLPINLLIADDHQLIIDGLIKILETEKTIGNIYSVNNGKEAVDKALTCNIDCVIMDINMPVLNGLEATKLIKKAKPEIKVIVVSMLCDASIVSKMMKAGADAFINKDTGKIELLKAIEKLRNNEKYISPEIAEKLLLQNTDDKEPHELLSNREFEIFKLLAFGKTITQIAESLSLALTTVSTHRSKIMEKLNLTTNSALTRYAIAHHIISDIDL